MDKLEIKLNRAEGMLSGLVLKDLEVLSDYNINPKLLSEAGMFYIGIATRIQELGNEVVDEVNFSNIVETLNLTDTYKRYGGWQTVRDMMSIIDIRNADSIVDEFTKWNLVKRYKEKGILDVEKHWNKIIQMTSGQVADYIEYQINDIDINTSSDIVFEDLSYNDDEIQGLIDGVNIGVQYGKHSPLLNYLTLGVAKSNIYLYGGYTNSGKSSFIFENMILAMVENKVKCCVISNEQKSDAFKVLLQVHILTERLNYYKLTRKKIRSGKFTEEDMVMMKKAVKIAKEEYDPYLKFVKIYDYDTNKVNKIVKKLSKIGTEVFFYDTFKIGDSGDGAVWEKLLEDSKELFNVLSNGKQIAEVVETGVYMRDLWADEWNGETYDIKPYRQKKDGNGKFTNDREEIILDKEKKYKIMFLSKTRSDENGVAVLYEFNGAWNKWVEIGKCNPHTKNNY